MLIRSLFFVHLVLLTLPGWTQTFELPAPVYHGSKYIMSPSLLPDSSIIVGHGTPDDRIVTRRFVYNGQVWKEETDQITEILNAITTSGHLHYRFSQDF